MSACPRPHALVFPGQGSQRVQMGAAVLRSSSTAREVFAEAADTLGWDVQGLCSNGPQEQLSDTRYAQVAVHVTNLAVAGALREVGISPVAVAGHSVGELSALVHVGALLAAEALWLVARRGELMASMSHDGLMLSIAGLEAGPLDSLCHRLRRPGGLLCIAAVNAPRHMVVSGTTAEVEDLARRLAASRGVRTSLLPVSGPFHSAAYLAAQPEWAAAVDATTIRPPALPFVSSVTGTQVTEPDSIRRCLVAQLTRRVEWGRAVAALRDLSARCLIEAGEGAAVSRLGRLNARGMSSCTIAWGWIRSAGIETSLR